MNSNVLIIGKTGVGKSTLLNAILEEEIVKTGMVSPVTNTSGFKFYERSGIPFRICDSIGFELDEKSRERSVTLIKDFCEERRETNTFDSFLHAVWYCVSSDSDRLELFEAQFINDLPKDLPVVLVVTKSYRKLHSERLIKELKKIYPDIKILDYVSVLAKDEDEDDCDYGEKPQRAFGLDDLKRITVECTKRQKNNWLEIQRSIIEKKKQEARKIVSVTAMASFGEGFFPLPFSDAIAIVPTQLGMLAGITKVFDITVSDDILKSVITSLIGTAGVTIVGRSAASGLIKMIPGVGTVVGGVIGGTTASVLTTALGEAYIGVMQMIVEGKLSQDAFETGEAQEMLKGLFFKNYKRKK